MNIKSQTNELKEWKYGDFQSAIRNPKSAIGKHPVK